MEKVYKSKLGLELIIPIAAVLVGVSIPMLVDGAFWLWLILIGSLALFIFHLFLTTYYTIKGETLLVKCGFLHNIKIDIDSIKKISETNSLLASPATSLDRLEISYNRFDSILISPKEKEDFIKVLTVLNPKIEVKYKNKNV